MRENGSQRTFPRATSPNCWWKSGHSWPGKLVKDPALALARLKSKSRNCCVHRYMFPLCSLVSFVVIVSLTLGCYGGAPKHPSWKNATGGEQYERLMWQAIRDKEWSSVHARLAPTFTGSTAAGRILDRDGWENYWTNAAPKEFSIADLSVQANGPDMVITYVLHLSGSPLASGDAGWRVMSVWQEVKGGWILIASSHTPIQAN